MVGAVHKGWEWAWGCEWGCGCGLGTVEGGEGESPGGGNAPPQGHHPRGVLKHEWHAMGQKHPRWRRHSRAPRMQNAHVSASKRITQLNAHVRAAEPGVAQLL